MYTCTWAPTVFHGTQISGKSSVDSDQFPDSDGLTALTTKLVQRYEALGLTHLLIAQRWWGSGEEIETSSLDCLAMTAIFATCTQRVKLITAVHPGFFQPTAIAKWGATLDRLTGGRWAINVTSGWNMQEFDMFGIDKLDHAKRYARSAEFVEVLRGAWQTRPFSYAGHYYTADELLLEPKPGHPLEVFQGGQSDDAIGLAAAHSDWMFLNGGSLERIESIVRRARLACSNTGRTLKFAMYAAPLCRATDSEAWTEIDNQLAAIDVELVAKRRARVQSGAQGMWSDDQDPLSMLDTNEGYASRLIGSPATIVKRIEQYRQIGIDMLHLDVSDAQFTEQVLPEVQNL
jgi:FMNH2-dependent dimethyl sulfone monooxygenase